jgi:hypothetical protein
MINTSKTIENARIVGGDYFKLMYSRRSNLNLSYFLTLFNFDNYWCLKSSGKQRQVTYEEFLDFEYSSYILFRKDLYHKEYIDMWIDSFRVIGLIPFLDKPFPPYHPNKIIIKK